MRILIALDGSVSADAVCQAVAPWLKQTGSRAELLTVLDESEIQGMPAAAATVSPPEIDVTDSVVITPQGTIVGSALRTTVEPRMTEDRSQALVRAEAEVRDRLGELAARYLAGIDHGVHVYAAPVTADAILAQAQELGVDAIAMGTHGRTGAARLVLGGIAEEVLRRSLVPVFLTRVVN